MKSNPADVTTRAWGGGSYTKALSPTFALFCLNLRISGGCLKKISVPICQILLRGNILPGCSGSSTREFLQQWRKFTEETAWKIRPFPHLQSYIYTALRCKYIYIFIYTNLYTYVHIQHTHTETAMETANHAKERSEHFFNPKLICLSPGKTNTAGRTSTRLTFSCLRRAHMAASLQSAVRSAPTKPTVISARRPKSIWLETGILEVIACRIVSLCVSVGAPMTTYR